VSIAGNGLTVADFQGNGVWRYEDSTGWQQLSPFDATSLSIDANGDLPLRGQRGWQQLSPFSATQVSSSGSGDVLAEFPGAGLWLYDHVSGWHNLSPTDAAFISLAVS
jgi:hypothetical protein